MDGEQSESEIYVPTAWERIVPVATTLATWLMNVGLGVAFIAAVYLLIGVLGGGLNTFNAQPHADRLRILGNINLAAGALNYGLIAAAVGAAIAFFAVDTMGYALFGGAAVIGVLVPYASHLTSAGQSDSFATGVAITAFVHAALVPGIVGGALIARDIVKRLAASIRERKLEHKDLTYGGDAQAAPKPVRTSLLAKCWEGPYCRDFIRPHCPIFLARKACWREKRGCYCEEDIVAAAASKINGVVLDMAPDPKQNYANVARQVGTTGNENAYRKPALSHAQKVQRCKYCVIFNEHEREKYTLLVPIVIIGTIALCAFFSLELRNLVGGVLGFTQGLVDRFSFTTGPDAPKIPKINEPNATVEWVFVGAFVVMIVSKALQTLEWACFKAKI